MNSLRVIAGKARGQRLHTVPGDSTRPITDRAKESLFNVISVDIVGSSFLDLFAGTGSVGIEALSRGAKFARFVDRQRQAIQTICKNLSYTGFTENAEVLRIDAFTFLQRTVDRTFDYVFIAPPQYKGIWKRALLSLDDRVEWLEDGAWIIIQIHPIEYEEVRLHNLYEFDRRKYGSVLFSFYQFQSHPQNVT
jgi:16S rRNA (guanine(966)-N(2))-methyltransferase RsmD